MKAGTMMKKAVLALMLFSKLTVRAYVLNYDANGAVEHWDLSGTNTLVVTNIVNRNTRAIRYYLSGKGYSATNTAAELNALRASFAQWQAISGTTLKFEEAGVINTAVDVNMDGSNILFWATNTLVGGGLDDISGALGVTYGHTTTGNLLVEADIVFNGAENQWFTDFNAANDPNYFVEATALHEIGHFIGLNHSPLGGATMFWAGSTGIGTGTGLSTDDIAAARRIYGTNAFLATLGTVRGRVTMNGTNLFGGVVCLEDSKGNLVAATVTLTNGTYELAAIPPGNYQTRVTPLDPDGVAEVLVNPDDIAWPYYLSAEVNFLPTVNSSLTVPAGNVTNNISVTAGTNPFHISEIRRPTTTSGFEWNSLPYTIYPGQSNLTVGIASPDIPNGSILSLSGDGVTLGGISYVSNLGGSGLNFLSAVIGVASNATPGLRTFVVQFGGNRAYANGFLEILPLTPDYNFDGLDDRFQRQYFPLWTVAQAGPNVDADGDGANNYAEAAAGTNPTNALSLLKVQSITHTAGGATITWQSVSGKSYQVSSRLDFSGSTWQNIGSPVTAAGATAQYFDASGTTGNRFYRVQPLP